MRTILGATVLASMFTGCGGLSAPFTVYAVGDNRVDAGEWVVDITKWITTIDHVQLSDDRDRVFGDDDDATVIVDLMDAEQPVEIEVFDARVGTWTLNFGSEPPERTNPWATRLILDTEVVEMERNGWTHLIEGRGIGPAPLYEKQPIYAFRFGFAAPVRNLGCGLVDVLEDGTGEVTIGMVTDEWLNIRPDSVLPDVTFLHLAAADRNADLVITTAELQNTTLAQAGVPSDDGSTDLYSYLVEALGRTMVGTAEDCAARN